MNYWVNLSEADIFISILWWRKFLQWKMPSELFLNKVCHKIHLHNHREFQREWITGLNLYTYLSCCFYEAWRLILSLNASWCYVDVWFMLWNSLIQHLLTFDDMKHFLINSHSRILTFRCFNKFHMRSKPACTTSKCFDGEVCAKERERKKSCWMTDAWLCSFKFFFFDFLEMLKRFADIKVTHEWLSSFANYLGNWPI